MGYDKFFHVGDKITILDEDEIYTSKIVRFVSKFNNF